MIGSILPLLPFGLAPGPSPSAKRVCSAVARFGLLALLLVACWAGCSDSDKAPPAGPEAFVSPEQAVQNLLDIFERAMMNRDIDLLASILSEDFQDDQGRDKWEKLRDWAGPYPPVETDLHGFLFEIPVYFRLEDRKVELGDDSGSVDCREESQWINGFFLRETRVRGFAIQVRKEEGGVWRILSIDRQGDFGQAWSNEIWYPPVGEKYVGGLAAIPVTAQLYDERGFPKIAGLRVQLYDGQWMGMAECDACPLGLLDLIRLDCCPDYCVKHVFNCRRTYPSDRARRRQCIESKCFGEHAPAPDFPGLKSFPIELSGQDGSTIRLNHRFRIVGWNREDWEHVLVVRPRNFIKAKFPSEMNNLSSVCVGPDGAVWFGTMEKGRIYRYDGALDLVKDLDGGPYERPGNYYGIPTLVKDAKDNLWCGVAGHLYDPQRNIVEMAGKVLRYDGVEWTEFGPNLFGEGKSPRIIDALPDGQGGVWFAGEGVIYWDGEREAFTRSYSKEDGIGAKEVNCLLLDDQGDLWCGTTVGGISRFDGSRWETYTYSPYTPAQVEDLEDYVQDLMESILNSQPLKIVLDPIGGLFKGMAKEDIIYSAGKDRRGWLWFGTYGGGILVYRGGDPKDRRSWDQFTVANTLRPGEEGLLSNIIFAIAQDPLDRMWFCTSSGINCLDDHGTPGKDDDEWISYRVELFNSDLETPIQDWPYRSVALDMVFDEQGTPWFATMVGGLLHLKNPPP